MAEGDTADITCGDCQNTFNEISHKKLMEKLNCHEEGLWFEMEAT